jgi:hypothetical protein
MLFLKWKLVLFCVIVIIVPIIMYFASQGMETFANKQLETGILIYSYNGPEKLKEFLDKLKQTVMKEKLNDTNTIIYILDDHSDNKRTIEMIDDYELKNSDGKHIIEVIKDRNLAHFGLERSKEKGFMFLEQKCKDYYLFE